MAESKGRRSGSTREQVRAVHSARAQIRLLNEALKDDPRVRAKIAQLSTQAEVARCHGLRFLSKSMNPHLHKCTNRHDVSNQ